MLMADGVSLAKQAKEIVSRFREEYP